MGKSPGLQSGYRASPSQQSAGVLDASGHTCQSLVGKKSIILGTKVENKIQKRKKFHHIDSRRS